MAIRSQAGQTVVEYILLLAVSVSLVVTMFNSKPFKKLFGEEGTVGVAIKSESEFGYQHAYLRNHQLPSQINYPGTSHPSYYDTNTSSTRFFGPKEPYQ